MSVIISVISSGHVCNHINNINELIPMSVVVQLTMYWSSLPSVSGTKTLNKLPRWRCSFLAGSTMHCVTVTSTYTFTTYTFINQSSGSEVRGCCFHKGRDTQDMIYTNKKKEDIHILYSAHFYSAVSPRHG